MMAGGQEGRRQEGKRQEGRRQESKLSKKAKCYECF
jgi:hypothetical protein